MWVPSKVVEWFTSMKAVAEVNAAVSVEAINHYREEVSALRAERDTLRGQLAITQTNFDWLRMRVNTLEVEKAGLIEKAYGIKIPAPELIRTPAKDPTIEDFSFDDMGEDLAKKLGLPVYEN